MSVRNPDDFLQQHRDFVEAIRGRRNRRRLDREKDENESDGPRRSDGGDRGADRPFVAGPRKGGGFGSQKENRPMVESRGRGGKPLNVVQKRKVDVYGPTYSPEEETVRFDYSLNYVNSGRRPQNFIQNPGEEGRFNEYPKLRNLLELKKQLLADPAYSLTPTYLQADLRTFDLTSLLPTRYDVILIDPPLEEYARTYTSASLHSRDQETVSPSSGVTPWTWEQLAKLPLPHIASSPSFIFLWVGSGSGDGLERGRDLLAGWGYRRCEDIVWVKTNQRSAHHQSEPQTDSLFVRTQEHCLMGIKGTVRRATDQHFAHCNVDLDVLIWEPEENDPIAKPPELYTLIENFCLGTRRLELFGRKRNLRRGWLTVGNEFEHVGGLKEGESIDELPASRPYQKDEYDEYFQTQVSVYGNNLVPNPPEIDALRPKSPTGRGPDGGPSNSSQGGLGRGGFNRGPRGQANHGPNLGQRPRNPNPAFLHQQPPMGYGMGANFFPAQPFQQNLQAQQMAQMQLELQMQRQQQMAGQGMGMVGQGFDNSWMGGQGMGMGMGNMYPFGDSSY